MINVEDHAAHCRVAREMIMLIERTFNVKKTYTQTKKKRETRMGKKASLVLFFLFAF